ncbi:hypothetical protein HMPREF3214_00817 [Alloscardovia omnicolens]|nr:hypothetical protein HMPREF3214_00817 [Alloscardovia omnicolens]
MSGVKTSLQCECVYFMSEVDTRNRYASFEAIFCASKLAQQVY